ncbi:lantibiotic dehydratase [Nonomuraea sp. KM88]|uniref:lantibiotic dehydratase n=1 Tax=Nonomuraea sp. KM88 TaxID=3457427 RepID=UPI003FCE0CD3
MAQPGSGPVAAARAYGTGLYAASDLFVLRAPVLPADTFVNLGANAAVPAPAGTAETLAAARAEGRGILRTLAASPRVRQAIQVASPSLAAALPGLDENVPRDRAADRAHAALLRYLIRMSTRPTPLGLFAGVAPGAFLSEPATGGEGIATLDRDPVRATRTRADSAWLAHLVERIGRDPKVRDKLRVRVNALLRRVGDRAVLVKVDGMDEPERIELAVNPAFAAVLDLAGHDPAYGELAAALAHRFPSTSPEKIRALLDRLWDLGVLLPDLLPSPTEPLPEVHLAKRLIDQDVPTGVIDGLTRLRQLADDVDRGPRGGDAAGLARLEAHQRAMAPDFTGPAFQIDAALALEPATLPADVAATAAEAAELLMRLGCVRQRRPHIAGYHEVFLEHYGVDAEVPLLDVLSPETGLGPPDSYTRPARRHPWPRQAGQTHPERDRTLVELALHATRAGRPAVDLDDELIERLTVWRPDAEHSRPRTSLDLFFALAADSPEAVRDGRWRMVLNTIGVFGGWQAFGRFFDLFDEATVTRIRTQQRLEEALRPDTVFAELNYGVRHRGGNVAGHPPTRDYEVCVNAAATGPPVRQIPLADIVLGADADRFHLRSVSLGRPLSVGQTHALTATRAPNVCRALLEFSEDGYTPSCRFDWGAAADAPFLPRLVRGNVVVQPAQWTITAATFPACQDPDDFFRACRAWRRQWMVPRYVYLVELDNRLLLDLEHPTWVDRLHRHVTRLPARSGASVRLHEALPGPGDLWLRDRAGRPYHAELAVPLVLRDRTRMPEPAAARTSAPPATTRRWLAGDEWTHLKLYAAAELHDAIVAGPLRELLADDRFGRLVDRWFFIRYADPLPHLRLRFHARGQEPAAEVMSRCAAWARGLVHAGQATDLAFCSYDREVERYGGGHAIDSVETAFWADSQAAVELLHLLRTGRFDPDVVRVAALHELYLAWDGGLPPLDGDGVAAWMTDAARKRFRDVRPLLCEILTPGELRPDRRAPEYRAALEPVFARQRRPLAEAGRRVRDLASRGLLTGDERNVIESLAHIQSIRLAGIDRDQERLSRALWSLSRRAIRNRPATTAGARR